MVQKSLAIVLNRFSYGESSIITKCFLKDYGKISFIVHGAKNKKKCVWVQHSKMCYRVLFSNNIFTIGCKALQQQQHEH